METVIVEIPKSDGSEQYGIRPALLVSQPIKEISIINPFADIS